MKNDNHVWDNRHPTAQMLGRWQPWHEGHQKLFEEILKKTGQVNIMRVCNSGTSDTNSADFISNAPFFWGTGIHWPDDIAPIFTQSRGFSNMYTFVRFPDKVGLPVYLGTYSPNYDI